MPDPRDWSCGAGIPFLDPKAGSVQPCSLAADLPDYVKPLPATIEPSDIEYLRAKGALTLPAPEMRCACLRSYVRNVQPLFPLVDSFKILSIVCGTNADSEKLSLLLLQALIFVGSTWVDVRLVRKAGFLSRKAYRKSIYRKARLLYDADYEDDRITLIQSFVLFTSWWEGPNENKDPWHWIGVALSMSRTIGLHQSRPGMKLTNAERRLRRRLWWSLVARDTLGSLGLGRSPRILDNDFDVSPLEMDDFDFQTVPDLLADTIPQSESQQRVFSQLGIAFIKLVYIFGKIFKAAYPEKGPGRTAVLYSDQQLEGTNRMPDETRPLNLDQLKVFEKELQEWRQGVPGYLWHVDHLPISPAELERAELAHRGLLAMLYHASVMILNRPLVLPLELNSNSAETSETAAQDDPRAVVRLAAQKITQVALDFYEADLVDSLSATVISCLIPASINHAFDMTSKNPVVRFEASQKLEQCKAILEAFCDQQHGAPWALNIITCVVDRINQQKLQKSMMATGAPANRTFKVSAHQSSEDLPSVTDCEMDGFPPSATLPATSLLEQPRSRLSSLPEPLELNRLGKVGPLTPTASSFSTARTFSSTAYPSTPILTLEQSFPDNMAHLLTSDPVWLDFVGDIGAFGWTEGNLLP